MGYRKIGYSIVPEGQYVPAMADSLMRALGQDFEPSIGEALRALGSSRRFLTGLTLPDLLKMTSTKIAPGSEIQKQLVLLTLKVLNRAGYVSEDVPRVCYSEWPVLTAQEAVGNMLTKKLPWYTKESLGGERATVEVLATHLPIIIRELRYTERLRREYYSRLRTKIGDVGYKISHSLPITQQEKSLLMIYSNVQEDAPGHPFGLAGANEQPVAIPAMQTADPLVTEAFSLYQESTETGPGLRFYQMLSNTNMESLIWYIGPYARTLPLSIGYGAPMGPFMEYRLQPLDSLAWTPQDQMIGIRDIFADTGVVNAVEQAPIIGAEPGPATAKQLLVESTAWQLNAPTRVCGNPWNVCTPKFVDFPNVTLRLPREDDVSRYVWEFYSKWRQKVMTSEAGATEDTLYVDIALTTDRIGEAQSEHLNLDSFGIADYDQSVKDREIKFPSDRITETIYYVRSGRQLEAVEVDMTEFYSRQGVKAFRPAFAEYVIPPRMWFFRPDERAQSFIAARLGLNNDQMFRNRSALTISHNLAFFKRVTGNDGNFDAVAVIKAIMNLN